MAVQSRVPQGTSPSHGSEETERRVASTPMRLAPTVERLIGANDNPMLYDRAERRYVRITPMGARILDAMDRLDDHTGPAPTGEELVRRMSGGDPERARRAHGALTAFLGDLWEKGLLEGAPAPARSGGISFAPRWEVLKDPGRFLSPLVRLIGLLPRPFPLVAAFAVWAAAMAVAVVSAPPALAALDLSRVSWLWLLLTLVLVAVHEAAHGVVSLHYGVRPRSAGFALMLYVFPIAYMDRTDSYRLRSRGARAAICLAGPWVDTIAAAVSAVVTLAVFPAGSVAQATAAMFTLVMVLSLVYNLNPLIPSDGYQAVEAATGRINLRSRAFRWFGAKLLGRTPPGETTGLAPRAAAGYIALVVLTIAYPVLFVWFLLHGTGVLRMVL
ncbi:hypothetical protein GCM10007147_41630 [Nocardiopsis kunsanensis]|uniref:Peptidase M50 domain-containing protein n=1 Tax=Nocardiopsis kunsanensis TaxID=141693 RepID=A0A918XKN8_9ACTN|nr:site-2 protease family protein [Nocardiopsis kunsanensis]GHD35288.1 hypothetical protein GCM10007147_41630 [Nocardiopsis kunsanensis]